MDILITILALIDLAILIYVISPIFPSSQRKDLSDIGPSDLRYLVDVRFDQSIEQYIHFIDAPSKQ